MASPRPRERAEARRDRYMATVNADDGRRRREDSMVQIRKNKREESLMKKRREGQSGSPAAVPIFKLQDLPTMVANIWSDDRNSQLEGATSIRMLLSEDVQLRLSTDGKIPFDEVIQAGVLPRLIEFLEREDFINLQLEAAWAITNIATGKSEHTQAVIDHGAVPILIKLLGSSSVDVREQAVLALGNVSGDSPGSRDLVLNHGALLPLLSQLNEHSNLSMLQMATWALSNFCRGQPRPPFHQVKHALPILKRLIHSNDEGILKGACWTLAYLSDGTIDKIEEIIMSGVVPRLIELLRHPAPSVIFPALWAIGNIVSGDNKQTQFVIDHHALGCLLALITGNYKKGIRKEACYTISNITAGTEPQIQAVIEAGIVGHLVRLLATAHFDIKKEAAWAISNATINGNPEQIRFLVQQGCIKPFCDLLKCPDARTVMVCLEGLLNILKVGELVNEQTGGVNVIRQMIEEAEGVGKIENLQSHDNAEIYEMSVKILETYWSNKDNEDVNM